MGSRPMQTYLGSCHCGAVRFEVETDFPELTMCVWRPPSGGAVDNPADSPISRHRDRRFANA